MDTHVAYIQSVHSRLFPSGVPISTIYRNIWYSWMCTCVSCKRIFVGQSLQDCLLRIVLIVQVKYICTNTFEQKISMGIEYISSAKRIQYRLGGVSVHSFPIIGFLPELRPFNSVKLLGRETTVHCFFHFTPVIPLFFYSPFRASLLRHCLRLTFDSLAPNIERRF